MHYLYKITNTVNGKIYIGQTIDPVERWCHHKSQARVRCCQVISKAIRKYGSNVFIFEVIAISKNQNDANASETELVKQYDSHNKQMGYNVSLGGNGSSGYRHTEETKKIISMYSKRDRKMTDEKRQQIVQMYVGGETIGGIKKAVGINRNDLVYKVLDQYSIQRKGDNTKGKTWKIIDGKRVWLNKENSNSVSV